MVIHQSEQNNNNNSGVSSPATSTSTIISTSTNTSSSSATTEEGDEEEEEDGEILNKKDIKTTITTTQPHQHDPILRNEDGSMLTTPQNIPMVISKDQNKLIHLDPVPNFKDKADIKPWLQKIFYPMGIEIVIERSDNTKVVFKCKASKRGRKSRKSSTNGTPNNTTSTFENTVKECAEKFIIHDNKMNNDLKMTKSTSLISPPPLSSSPRGKKKRAVSSFNVCPFRIRATYSIRRLKWSIVVVNNIHSHELNFDPDSDEYKKFKAKLRVDNDLEAIKKFDELEYRKRSNLPIQTAMIPCDCGLTNEIESFNIVIPNTNPKPISTTTKRNILKKKTQQQKHTPTPTSRSKRTINDLIMKKTDKIVSVSPPPPPPLEPVPTKITPNEQISLDDIINNYSNMPLKSTNSNLTNHDWNINLLSDNGPQITNNANHLLYNLMNNPTSANRVFKANNDSQTDIIQAKDKIDDEENDEEVGVTLQRDSKDYEYNGTNQIANEYYHNDLDSYNTDHFYKFNGPFDSGNAVLINKYNNNSSGNNMNHELLSNNFIDDPLLNESHINSLIYNTNLELNINIMAPNTTTATDTNNINTNTNFMNCTPESWTNPTNNVDPPTSNTTTQPVNNEYNTINSNNNIIDLNEIDFTDIFNSATSNSYKSLPKPEESPFSIPGPPANLMIKTEHPSPHSNLQQQPTTGETLSNELNQFIVHLEETSKTQTVTATPVIKEEDEEEQT